MATEVSPVDVSDDVADVIQTTKSFRRKFLEFRGSTFFIVLSVSLATFSDIFLYGIIVPVVPFAFTQRLGVSGDNIEYYISLSLSLYSVAMIVGSIAFGYITDKVTGRRIIMILGLLVLLGSTILLCLCKSMALYLIGRILQGLSAGIVWTVGLAIVSDTASPDKVALMMSFPGLGVSLGMLAGPLIGGVVYERAGYYAVYYVAFGVLFLDIVLRVLMVEKSQLEIEISKLESKSSHSSPLETGQRESQKVATTLENISPGQVSVPEPNTKKFIRMPLIVKLCIKNPRLMTAMFQSVVLAWLFTTLDTTLTLHLNNIFGFDSLKASLMFLAVSVPAFIEPLVGYLCDKYGPKYLVSSGFFFGCPFLFLLMLPKHYSTDQVALFAACLAVFGTAVTCVMAPLFYELAVTMALEEEKHPGKLGHGKGYGQVYGLFNVAFSLGSIIGPLVSGSLYKSEGWTAVAITLGVLCGAGVIPSLMFTGGNLLRVR